MQIFKMYPFIRQMQKLIKVNIDCNSKYWDLDNALLYMEVKEIARGKKGAKLR